jgi:ABC-type multidrug transport system fused ATPase/permease subunit
MRKPKLSDPFSKFMGSQLLRFWHLYLFALISMFLTHWLQSEIPFYAKELGDLVVAKKLDEIPLQIYFYLAIGIIIFRTLSRALFFYPARVLQGWNMEEMISRLENANPARYDEYSPGQLYQIMQIDIQNIRAFVGFALLQVGNVIIAFSVLFPKLIKFEQKLVVAFVPMFVAVFIFVLITSYTQKYFKLIVDYQGDVQNFIIETYEGKKSIKNFHAEASFFQLFENVCMRELKVFFRATMGPATAIPLIKVGMGITFIWGAAIIFEQNLGSTSIILFSGFVFLFLSPLMFISWIGAVAARVWGSWQRIKDLLQKIDSQSHVEKEIEVLNKQKRGAIQLPLWDGVSRIELSDDKWLVLVGSTGAGKSTLLQNLSSYMRQNDVLVSFVGQEPYLYNDKIVSNLFLGRSPSEEELQQAYDLLILFGLDALEVDKSKLLELEVGENGKRVSGGQAKRIALVRSLLSNAEVIIWDDPFSSVDLILENQIIQELKRKNYFKGKKIVLSSHRLTTVKHCDLVYYLEANKGITEEGKLPEILMNQTKVYEHFKEQMA